MHNEGQEIHVSDTEASGGSKEGVVRWILLVGLLLAVVFLSLIWIVPALTQGDAEEEASVSNKIQSSEGRGDSTDSIVGADTFGDTPVSEDADPGTSDSENPTLTTEN